jgi:hypothetical protein
MKAENDERKDYRIREERDKRLGGMRGKRDKIIGNLKEQIRERKMRGKECWDMDLRE